MAATCASCGKKLGLLDRMGGQTLCDDCEDKLARAQQKAHNELIANAHRGILPSYPRSEHVMNLAAGEMVHWTVTGAQLMKVSRSYQRTGGGVSIPIGKTGIRTYVGQSRGKVVTTGIEVGDSGTFVLTSLRCIFTGTGTTEVLDYRHLLDIKVFDDGLQFHRYNRKTPVIIRLGRGTTETVATLLDVAAQKALGTWVGPPEVAQASIFAAPPSDDLALDAKRKAVSEAFGNLKTTFLAVASDEMFGQLAGRMTKEEVVAQEALRIAAALAAADAHNAPEELAVMADLLGTRLRDVTPEQSLAMVKGESFGELFKDAPLDGKVMYVGSLAARDSLAGTRDSRGVADAVLEFARVICAVDDHVGEDELEALSRLENDLRTELASHGIPWSESAAGAEVAADDTEVVASRSAEEVLEELQGLVGLGAVKKEVGDIVSLLRIQQLRKEQGLPVGEFTHHLVFAGNPGTGKTTVARLLGELYAELKVVPKGHLVEASRADLVAGYSGQTAIKTTELVERARGGILFVDEAYSLDQGAQDSFGREAIETLLKLMEDHRDDLIVFAAGYTDQMQSFMDSNPGLESRFKGTLTFEDYSIDELVAIFQAIAEREGYVVDAATTERFRAALIGRGAAIAKGNARYARRMFESAVISQANRLALEKHPSREELMMLRPDDVAVGAPSDHDAENPTTVGSQDEAQIRVAGRIVRGPDEVVARYLEQQAPAIARYDSRAYEASDRPLDWEDIRATRVIRSRISDAEGQWFLTLSQTAPWDLVATTASLADADPRNEGDLYDAAYALYAHFLDADKPAGIDVSVAKVHKVLHLKRPHLYPILDSRLLGLYRAEARNAASSLASESSKWKDWKYCYWCAIRLDVLDPGNQETLAKIRDRLVNSSDEATKSFGSKVSDVRLLDILTWTLG